MIEVSALQNFVSRGCGRRLPARALDAKLVALLATSLHLSFGGGAAQRGHKCFVRNSTNSLKVNGSDHIKSTSFPPTFFLPWWTSDCIFFKVVFKILK